MYLLTPSAVAVSWDIERYQMYCLSNHITDGSQLKLAQTFLPIHPKLHSITKLTTATDCYGRIIAWFLLDILPERFQVILILPIIQTTKTHYVVCTVYAL